MNAEKVLLALDLGERMGVAIGEPGAVPATRVVELRREAQAPAVGFGNLLYWLEKEFARPPAIVVKEAMIPLAGLKRLNTSEATVRWHHGLHAIVEAACYRAGVRLYDVNIDHCRRHFVGQRHFGSREATKRAVLQRCKQLGYLPAEHRHDDDRGDACAVWDWGCATLLRHRPKELVMFGGA